MSSMNDRALGAADYLADLAVDFANEDQTGLVWAWLDHARDESVVAPGGGAPAAPSWCRRGLPGSSRARSPALGLRRFALSPALLLRLAQGFDVCVDLGLRVPQVAADLDGVWRESKVASPAHGADRDAQHLSDFGDGEQSDVAVHGRVPFGGGWRFAARGRWVTVDLRS